jgi:hypothetical protein
MECMRRIDEYPILQDMFPAEGARIARSGRELPEEVELTESERAVFDTLKSPRPVRDVVARAKMPAFDTHEALKLLKEKGLVVVEADAQAAGEVSGATATAAARRRHGNPLVFFAAATLFIAAAFLGVWRNADRVVALARDGVLAHDQAARARVEYRLRWLIEAYRAENGFYPEDLDELGGSGLADPATLFRAASFDLRYKLTRDGDAYTLL